MIVAAAPRPVTRSAGLTLIEVVLVMSLLVVIASITMPFLGNSFSRAHLNAAGDILRDALTRGRMTAMQSGEIQAFRCEPKGARFQLVALDKLSPKAANHRRIRLMASTRSTISCGSHRRGCRIM
jgi:Tfp pilus assembly protein FimT